MFFKRNNFIEKEITRAKARLVKRALVDLDIDCCQADSHSLFRWFSYRTVALLLIIVLNSYALSAISYTTAFFSDKEFSGSNNWQAAVVDYLLVKKRNFHPAVTPDKKTRAKILITNKNTIAARYKIKAENFSGDTDFCQKLKLRAKKDGQVVYNGSLLNFSFTAQTTTTTEKEVLRLTVRLLDDDYQWWNKECRFRLHLSATQDPMATTTEPGFSDEEKVSLKVTSGAWGVVLNEIMANPSGYDNSLLPGGEWVELYNNNPFPVSVAGWVLYDAYDDHELYITDANSRNSNNEATTTIDAHGFLVVYRNGDGNFSLNNDGDTVRLYDGEISATSSRLIDSYVYTVEKAEGYSYARIPDGTGDWVDPLPTPGKSNKLSDKEEIVTTKNNSSKVIMHKKSNNNESNNNKIKENNDEKNTNKNNKSNNENNLTGKVSADSSDNNNQTKNNGGNENGKDGSASSTAETATSSEENCSDKGRSEEFDKESRDSENVSDQSKETASSTDSDIETASSTEENNGLEQATTTAESADNQDNQSNNKNNNDNSSNINQDNAANDSSEKGDSTNQPEDNLGSDAGEMNNNSTDATSNSGVEVNNDEVNNDNDNNEAGSDDEQISEPEDNGENETGKNEEAVTEDSNSGGSKTGDSDNAENNSAAETDSESGEIGESVN